MKIALLAMGPSADAYVRHCAVYGGRERFDQLWTVNAFGSIFNADLIFHMDDVRIQEKRAEAGNKQIAVLLDSLKKSKVPILTSRAHPDYPSMIDFPLEDVLNATGGPGYFNSTPAYALGYAFLTPEIESIACFGLDYAYLPNRKGERGRACIEYWLGRITGRSTGKGMKIELPKETFLMDANEKEGILYGYDTLKVDVSEDAEGRAKVEFTPIPESDWPTATEIEDRYNHE